MRLIYRQVLTIACRQLQLSFPRERLATVLPAGALALRIPPKETLLQIEEENMKIELPQQRI
jgi:hypothetical protein